MTDGAFDADGHFRPPAARDGHALMALFRKRLLARLVEQHAISQELSAKLQVAWGIADFVHRFGRRPRGLWLPETAADAETLEVLADHGIEFTILAPWQAGVRRLDPSEPYWIDLPSRRRLAAFFFDGVVSGRLSFDADITGSADDFARDQLVPARPRERRRDVFERVVLLASDGEIYGHHKEFRDHFLARLLDASAAAQGFGIAHPELWLARHRPHRTLALRAPGSWSCHHGVARAPMPRALFPACATSAHATGPTACSPTRSRASSGAGRRWRKPSPRAPGRRASRSPSARRPARAPRTGRGSPTPRGTVEDGATRHMSGKSFELWVRCE